MSGSGKQLIVGVWINREKWGLKTQTSIKTDQLRSCGLYHYKTPEGKLKSCFIVTVKRSLEEELATLILLLKEKEKTIAHFEMRKNDKTGATDIYVEVESKYYGDWNNLGTLIETLAAIDIHPQQAARTSTSAGGQAASAASAANTSPGEKDGSDETGAGGGNKKMEGQIAEEKIWYPRSIRELDNFQRVLVGGNELQADHPGFTDRKYRRRRRMFSEIALFYKHGDPIPRIHYTPEEQETWKVIYNKLEKLHDIYACKEFKENWKELKENCNYGPHAIPQLEDVNIYLKGKSGFQVRPVAGYLSPRDFLSGLAYRVFHCTQYIRHGSEPYYTPEPDCCHELIGHVPLLADKKFAQFSQDIGIASLGLKEKDLLKIASCYMFTVEFGLCIEDGELKIFGAGLLSSASEMEHVMKGIKTEQVCVESFITDKAIQTPCMVTTYQKRYFVTRDIVTAQKELRRLAQVLSGGSSKRYDPYTQCVLEDKEERKGGGRNKEEDELSGDIYLAQQQMIQGN